MATQDGRATPELIRTSVLIRRDTDTALRKLCEGKRPLSWEIREALEAHVERQAQEQAA